LDLKGSEKKGTSIDNRGGGVVEIMAHGSGGYVKQSWLPFTAGKEKATTRQYRRSLALDARRTDLALDGESVKEIGAAGGRDGRKKRQVEAVG